MISQLTGTLVEVMPSYVIIDVGGIGFELGVSHSTAAEMPSVGSSGVRLLTRLVVREDAMELYGFSTREERALFDRLVAISGVGPKLALAVLSTFRPADIAVIVSAGDAKRLAQVPGIGQRKAQRLLVDLEGVFQKDAELLSLVGLSAPDAPAAAAAPGQGGQVLAEAQDALLSMGFTSQEVALALEGLDDGAGGKSIEQVLAAALRRLGGGA